MTLQHFLFWREWEERYPSLDYHMLIERCNELQFKFHKGKLVVNEIAYPSENYDTEPFPNNYQ